MTTLSSSLFFFLHLAKIEAVMTRRFDASLGGIGFSDFQILYHLSQAKEEKMRRVDLAEKIGLTPSGITRLLAPMEKNGLIGRRADANDARVSYVILAPGGKRKLAEAMEDAELIAESMLAKLEKKTAKSLIEAMEVLAR